MKTPSSTPPTTSILKVPYGLRGNALIHISEIKTSERGRACLCVCPECDHPLIANLGSKKRHYFSHATQSNCAYAAETGLHLKAKELIARWQYVVLPGLTISVGSDCSLKSRQEGRFETATLVKEGTVARFDTMLVEEARGIIRPDVIGVLSGTELYIEIRVTHEVDEAKRDEIQRQAVSAIEIDLSGIDRMASPQVIAKALSTSSLTHWIFHRHEESCRKKMALRVQQAEKRIKEEKEQAEARRKQAKEDFKTRLAGLYRELNQCLAAGAMINLPRASLEPGARPANLPSGFGAGLDIETTDKDWMVWATRTDQHGEQERFIIAWDLHKPGRRPFRLSALFRLEAPFCIVDVSPLIKGSFQAQRSREEMADFLAAFLAAPRAQHDHWYRLPTSLAREFQRRQQAKWQRDESEAQKLMATQEKDRAERQAQQQARVAAAQKEQALLEEQRKAERRKQEAQTRDRHLKYELGKLGPLKTKGHAILQQVLERLEAIRITREAKDTLVPIRWHPVKEISARYPPLETAQADWINDNWQMLARPYPYEWAFAIHPDYLKVATLDSILALKKAQWKQEGSSLQEALQEALRTRLEQTRQPGGQAKGYGALYLRVERWGHEVEHSARGINHWLNMTCEGSPLPESNLTRVAGIELDAVIRMVSQAAGTPDRGATAIEEERHKLDVIGEFCAALHDDILRAPNLDALNFE